VHVNLGKIFQLGWELGLVFHHAGNTRPWLSGGKTENRRVLDALREKRKGEELDEWRRRFLLLFCVVIWADIFFLERQDEPMMGSRTMSTWRWWWWDRTTPFFIFYSIIIIIIIIRRSSFSWAWRIVWNERRSIFIVWCILIGGCEEGRDATTIMQRCWLITHCIVCGGTAVNQRRCTAV
jgi:hypothetical protein